MAVNNKIVTVGQVPTVNLDTDGTMAAASDTYVATQAAVRTYVAANMAGVLGPNGVVFTPTVMTVSGALPAVTFVQLNSTTPAIAATLAAPTPGRLLVITQTDAGTAGHTVTLAGGTWDGTNDVATFNAAAKTLVVFGVSATRFVILANIGTVTFS